MSPRTTALLLCTALACRHEGGRVSDAGAPFAPSTRPTVQSSEISINNLDGEIAEAQRPLHTNEALFRHRLPDLLLERVSYLGTTADWDAADVLSAKNAAAEPGDGAVRLTRAHVLAGLHEFDAALAELDAAEKDHADALDVHKSRATIFLATGRCAEASAIWPALPYATDMATRGAMEQQLGHPALGEALFERSRREYNDVSPLKLAWMDFERARAFEREGNRGKARAYLEDALAVLPEYAHAAVHLEVLEAPERALAHLAAVEKRADDPDVLAAHADALRRLGRASEARDQADRARARFEEMLAKHRAAYADHAARFFLGAGGDVQRALRLAKEAASRAPSEESLEVWLRAARAARSTEEACAAVQAAAKTTCSLGASQADFDATRASCKP